MPSYKKTPDTMRECVGPECGGCSSGNCYAKGGETGVHAPLSKGSGMSSAGAGARTGWRATRGEAVSEKARDAMKVHTKNEHHRVLGEMKSMPKPKLYAEGGAVDSWTKREDNEKGVHHKYLNKEGESAAGKHVRGGINSPAHDEGYSVRSAKREHEKVLGEMRGMKKPNLYAEGGSVGSGKNRQNFEKGVNHDYSHREPGVSVAGKLARAGEWTSPNHVERAKSIHKDKLKEMKSMPKPNLYADGGEVHDDIPEPDPKNAKDMQKGATSGGTSSSEAWKNLKSGLGFSEGGEIDADGDYDGDTEMDSELKQVMGDEFMSAIERKDKKAIMSTLEAIVLSCRGMK